MKIDVPIKPVTEPELEENKSTPMFTPLDDDDFFDSIEEMEAFIDHLLAMPPSELLRAGKTKTGTVHVH